MQTISSKSLTDEGIFASIKAAFPNLRHPTIRIDRFPRTHEKGYAVEVCDAHNEHVANVRVVQPSLTYQILG